MELLRAPILQGHAAYARRAELVIRGIDYVRRAEPLVSNFLPLGDERRVGELVFEAVVVNLFRDLAVDVVHVVDISGALPVDLVDRPHTFRVALAGVRFADLVAELVFKGGEDGFDVAEALGGLVFGVPSIGRHRIYDRLPI